MKVGPKSSLRPFLHRALQFQKNALLYLFYPESEIKPFLGIKVLVNHVSLISRSAHVYLCILRKNRLLRK